MSIPERGEIIKVLRKEAFLVTSVLLIGLSSFGLGRLSAVLDHREEVRVCSIDDTSLRALSSTALSAPPQEASSPEGLLVASKAGSRYYLPTCSGAARILESNKVWFKSRAEAEAAGYAPAANCPGL